MSYTSTACQENGLPVETSYHNQTQLGKKWYVLTVSSSTQFVSLSLIQTRDKAARMLGWCHSSLCLRTQPTFGAGSISLARWPGCRPSGTQPGASSSMFLPPQAPGRTRADSSEWSVFGQAAWKVWVRTDRTCSRDVCPIPRNEYSAGEPEAGVQVLVFYSHEKRLSWICLHEPMCTTSFYVKL